MDEIFSIDLYVIFDGTQTKILIGTLALLSSIKEAKEDCVELLDYLDEQFINKKVFFNRDEMWSIDFSKVALYTVKIQKKESKNVTDSL